MSKEALKLALEALRYSFPADGSKYETELEEKHRKAIKALEEALAKQEQGEPVAWCVADGEDLMGTVWENKRLAMMAKRHFDEQYGTAYADRRVVPLYTTPYVPEGRQQRKPLTDEQKLALLKKHFNAVTVPDWFDALLIDIEAAHGIKE